VLGISISVVTVTIMIDRSSLLAVLGAKMAWQMTRSDLAERLVVQAHPRAGSGIPPAGL